MTNSSVKIWSKSPAVRFLLPLVVGIILQWYLLIKVSLLLTPAIILLILLIVYNTLQVLKRFRYKSVNGIIIQLLFLFIGALLVYKQDIRNDPAWFAARYTNNDYLRVTLEEPLIEKPNSFKAVASVKSVYNKDNKNPAEGKLIIYFKKDSSLGQLSYGSQLLIHRPVAPIQNSGNPGAFDYKRFCLFDDGITHQVYLAPEDYIVLPGSDQAYLESLLFKSRANTIDILKRNIQGEKEQGLAEALLIGYKYDLDKNLLQAYSNTGVVHIIAISGLHLALIYGLLVFATRFLGRRKLYWLRIGIILLGIWSFTLLAGTQPSVLRAAVMFSFIGLGELLGRKTSIYNSLALSAFLLLLLNPFFLWDVGFQLSYAAVFSIVAFFKPIYNWFYFKNKLVDSIWKLNAVTIAAQLFTLPISIYHFHQFPLLVLVTNMVAVPLSSMILVAEIILCLLSFINPLANAIGSAITFLISFMNNYIEGLDQLPIAVWDDISLNVVQTILLTAIIATAAYGFMEKYKKAVLASACFLLLFLASKSKDAYTTSGQHKLLVYNIPKHQAVDVIYANKYLFRGDDHVINDPFIKNFHIKPARVNFQLDEGKRINSNAFTLLNKNILILDTTSIFNPSANPLPLDILILSKNPRLYINEITKTFSVKQVVADGSVPPWKARLWKKDCDSLRIPFHYVTESGAFIMNL